MYRTPAKDMNKQTAKSPDSSPYEPSRATVAQARTNIESRLNSSDETRQYVPPKQRSKPGIIGTTRRQTATGSLEKFLQGTTSTTTGTIYKNRTAEAKACLQKTQTQINYSKNLKTEIKTEVIEAAERLYKLVKEAEEGKPYKGKGDNQEQQRGEEEERERERKGKEKEERDFGTQLEEHAKLLRESKEEMERLNEELRKHREDLNKIETYASVTATVQKSKPIAEEQAMHSVVISSRNENETGDQVFEKIRKTVNATNEGIQIDNIRKAKDRRVILGCNRKEEIARIKEKIRRNGGDLEVDDVRNKDPLVAIKYVLKVHTDDEILGAIRHQNKNILKDIKEEEDRMRVKYRKNLRNPHITHVILQVSPQIWQKMTMAGALHVDVQKVKVEDQSPLIQCSRCLGYGHGRRFCKETTDKCSHCGDQHFSKDCPQRAVGERPECCNCKKANYVDISHNAFDADCPVRRRWDQIARSATAYC